MLPNHPVDDAGCDRRRGHGAGRVRGTAARRFREFCGALFSRAQPAHPVCGELALRAHGREARRGARGPDPPTDRQRAAAPSEVTPGLGRLSGLVSGARPEHADPLPQLCPGPCRQIVARLPPHRCQRLVPAALPDAALAAASGGARVRDDRSGLPHRHLGRRGADRARCRPNHHRRSAEAEEALSQTSGRRPTTGSTTPSTAG